MPSIGKERQFGQLLKTGQTTQYGSYPDDGDLEKGLSRLYAVLDAGQYAGTVLITLYDKTDLISNNCIYDQRTKLMWSRYPSDGLGPASDGKLPWTTNVNGEGIFPYVALANVAKLAGYSDWRIPNILECFSLVLFEAPAISVDPTAWPLGLTVSMWSATTRPSSTSNAVSFVGGGNLIGLSLKTATALCLLVRSAT